MSVDRSRHAPITCKYNSTITKAHANRHFPVILDVSVEAGQFDFPTVGIQGATAAENAKIHGELLGVYPETETCEVQFEGLQYYRAKEAYAMANNGDPIAMSDTADQVKPVATVGDTSGGDVSALIDAIVHAPHIEGGFTIDESGTTINILKCRR